MEKKYCQSSPKQRPGVGSNVDTRNVSCATRGGELPNCTQSNGVYESICTVCNPEATKKGELEHVKEGALSLFVGESSRSIQERAKDESHMHKHQALRHPYLVFAVLLIFEHVQKKHGKKM